MKARRGWWKAAVGVVALALGASSAAAADPRQDRIERLEREIERLRDEVESLKEERKEAPSAAPSEGVAATAAAIADRVKIGGYGSLRFEHNTADDTFDTFTFRRFVLTADAAVAPKLRFYFELEFERFRKLELERGVEVTEGGLKVEQEVEGTNESELAMEQVWLEYAFLQELRLQAGGLLVPLGRFNINHDDNRWDLPRRSLADRGAPVMPVKSAWNELGVGFAGDLEVGDESKIDYRLYVMNGAIFEPEVEEILQTRVPSRDKLELEGKFGVQTGVFGADVKDDKAVTGRVAFSPALGHEMGGSFYYGRYTPDFLPDEAISAFGLDGLTTWGPFELEGEFLYSDFGDVENVVTSFARTAVDQASANPAETNPNFEAEIEFEVDQLAETRYGYWIEPRWRFRPQWLKDSFFGRDFEDPVLTAVVRWEQVWVDGLIQTFEFEESNVTALDQVDRRLDRFTIGGSYRPVPLVAFQLAYEFTRADSGALSEVTNFLDSGDDEAHAILVGAAFGF
ncbi:MAG: hypothetical protein ACREQJ_02770 [Candidatus Binatia bacterium]